MPAPDPKDRFSFYNPHATKATVQGRQRAPTRIARATPEAEAKPATVEEGKAQYTTAPAWIDAQGRTRTWAMFNPHGVKMAEITTKTAALTLAAMLTDLTRKPDGDRSR